MCCINHQLRARKNCKSREGRTHRFEDKQKLKILQEAELLKIEKIAGDGEKKKVDIKNK